MIDERGEVAYILLGELALLTLAAIPLGLAIGYGLCAYLAYAFQSDLYRIALVLERDVYALAALGNEEIGKPHEAVTGGE